MVIEYCYRYRIVYNKSLELQDYVYEKRGLNYLADFMFAFGIDPVLNNAVDFNSLYSFGRDFLSNPRNMSKEFGKLELNNEFCNSVFLEIEVVSR